MELKKIDTIFSVCKIQDLSKVNWESKFCFIGKTDEEISLVCPTMDVPSNAIEREDGWRAFRIQGVLDFSLVGVLAKLSALLAEKGIGIFAISTFNTDYILTKEENFSFALEILSQSGYQVICFFEILLFYIDKENSTCVVL